MRPFKYIIALSLFAAFTATAQQKSAITKSTITSKMDVFISNLMSKMTVEEKIGQLNLLTGGEAITGSTGNSDIENKVKRGDVGEIGRAHV